MSAVPFVQARYHRSNYPFPCPTYANTQRHIHTYTFLHSIILISLDWGLYYFNAGGKATVIRWWQLWNNLTNRKTIHFFILNFRSGASNISFLLSILLIFDRKVVSCKMALFHSPSRFRWLLVVILK